MGHTIAPSQNGKYLVCRIEGTVTKDVAVAFTKEMDRMSRQLHIKRFLHDVRTASNVLGVLDNYNYAYKEMPALNLQRDVRSAILAAPADRTHDFVATVLQNAGYDARVFREESKALEWLEE